MTISDDQLSSWTKPWFNNEEERAEKTKELVKSAVDIHLKDLNIRVFAKGSYPNNTNVRKDSDIDIAVELRSLINLDYVNAVSLSDIGLSQYSGISELDFKFRLKLALESEFGKNVVDSSGNKVFKIRGSNKILDADVIPCTTYRYYLSNDPQNFRQGIQLILNNPDGKRHFNYPDQHLQSGIDKNTSTMKRFKNTVRILKNINNYLFENSHLISYPSFMIESMAYNINSSIYTANDNWRDIILRICENSWNYLKINEGNYVDSNRWLEANGYKYLFHQDQKWNRDDAKQFVINVYGLLKN